MALTTRALNAYLSNSHCLWITWKRKQPTALYTSVTANLRNRVLTLWPRLHFPAFCTSPPWEIWPWELIHIPVLRWKKMESFYYLLMRQSWFERMLMVYILLRMRRSIFILPLRHLQIDVPLLDNRMTIHFKSVHLRRSVEAITSWQMAMIAFTCRVVNYWEEERERGRIEWIIQRNK